MANMYITGDFVLKLLLYEHAHTVDQLNYVSATSGH